MKNLWIISSFIAICLSPAYAATNYFCPGKNQTISVGMSDTQVSSACGQPLSIQKSQGAATEKVPVQQLIYNEAGAQKVFYGVWQISQGHDHGGVLVVSIMDNKVVDIKMDGGSVNVSSICDNGNFSVGDPVSKVYSACGNPSNINNTFTKKVLPGVKKPETWIYQFGQYQPPLRLHFQGGKLISIDDSNE